MAPDGEAPNPAFRSRWALVLLAAALLAGGLAGAAGAGLLGTGAGAQVAEGGAEAEAVAVAEAGSESTPTSSPPASFPPSEPVPLTGLQRKDMFGTAVALSADGSVLAASAPYAAGDRGQVSAFLRQGNETDGGEGGSAAWWVPLGQVLEGSVAGDFLGGGARYPGPADSAALDLSSDGTVLAAAAAGEEGSGAARVHVFALDRSSRLWVPRGDPIPVEDGVAASLSLGRDGTVLAVGCPLCSGTDGLVRLYAWDGDGGHWGQVGNDVGGGLSVQAGQSVAIGGLGAGGDVVRVALGAPYASARVGLWGGRVRLLEWGGSGGPSRDVGLGVGAYGGRSGDRFGTSVAASADGTVLAVGADMWDRAAANLPRGGGEVRVLRWNATSAGWEAMGQVLGGEAGGRFGAALSLADGGTVLAATGLGDPDECFPVRWQARAFLHDEATALWEPLGGTEVGGTRQIPPTVLPGSSVDMSGDGRFLAVGAPESDANGWQSGEVRVFRLHVP